MRVLDVGGRSIARVRRRDALGDQHGRPGRPRRARRARTRSRTCASSCAPESIQNHSSATASRSAPRRVAGVAEPAQRRDHVVALGSAGAGKPRAARAGAGAARRPRRARRSSARARCGRPRPRPPRRASRARTRGSSRASGSAVRRDHLQQRAVDQRGEPVEHVAGRRRRRRRSSRRARAGTPPACGRARARASVSRSQLQSTTARSVRWRGSAVRLPPVSSRKRSSRRAASCSTGIVRSRAAASSIASGSPSRRRQISRDDVVVERRSRADAAAARSANSAHGGLVEVQRRDRRRGSRPRSPAARGWWRRSAGPGQPASSWSASSADGADQVLAVVEQRGSSRARPARRAGGRGRRAGDRAARSSTAASRRPSAASMAGTISTSAVTGASSTIQTPSWTRSTQRRQRLAREPRLARAAGADQRDQPRAAEQLADPLDLRVAADEARDGRAQVAARGPWAGGRVALEDGEVRVLQLGRRRRAELVGQPRADPLVGGERVGLAAGGVERGDVAGGEALVQRVLGERGLELGDDPAAVAEGELGLGAVGERVQALVFELRGGGEQRLAREVGQRGAAPQAQRLAERRRRRPAGRRCAARSTRRRRAARSGARRRRRRSSCVAPGGRRDRVGVAERAPRA